MYQDDRFEDRGLIPDGKEVTARVSGGIRSAGYSESRQWRVTYLISFEVVDGPYAGRTIYRNLWDTPTGRGMMNRDVRELGLTDPDELCRSPLPEITVRARIGVGTDYRGDQCNTVKWFARERPEGAGKARPQEEVDTDGAF